MALTPLPIRSDRIQALITERFGSVDTLVVEWEERVCSEVQKKGKARQRNTIYRWLKEGLPTQKSDIFGFAGVLDVDPIAILAIDEAFIAKYFPTERPRVSLNSESLGALAPFWPVYRPGPGWPLAEIARDFYGRAWCTQEFVHDHSLVTNEYVALYLEAHHHTSSETPRAYHFAYRRRHARDGMWRPYGTVIAYADETILVSESGDCQRITREPTNEPVPVETYFGAGEAEFKVASLHAFGLEITAPSRESGCVRFCG